MLLSLIVALVGAADATAGRTPTFRSIGAMPLTRQLDGQLVPRVRTGTIAIPKGHGRPFASVIVSLRLPSLAAERADSGGDGIALASRASQTYLARLGAVQREAVAALRRALPDARIDYRYRIVMDALAVRVPYRELPTLLNQPFVRKVYPSVAYTLDLNESPSVIGAEILHATTGANGEGIKIGIVDDGVDPTNPFFNPAGFSFPPGFPKGQTRFTSPKVIVARTFPGPGSGAGGRLALDRRASFHGTHVAGIAAGDAGTNAPAGRDHPPVAGLSGIAPRAWIGNYRVFNTPTPIGNSATSAQIVAAFESAVADGMDVLNFSGGGPELDPGQDALMQSVRGVTQAGVVVAIAAGNDRAEFGFGSVSTPGTAPDAITVAAVSNRHIFAQVLTVTSPAVPGLSPQVPFEPSLTPTPPAWVTADQTLVDVGTLTGTDGKPVDPYLCGPPSDLNNGAQTALPKGSLTGAIAFVLRGTCSFLSKSQRAKAAGAIGIIYVNNRPGDPSMVPVPTVVAGGMISDLDGAKLRSAMAVAGGRAKIKVGVDPVQIETRRSGVPAYFSSAGPTSYNHALKPDIAAPGQQILSSTLPEFAGSPFAVFDGTSMATPHIAGSAALLKQLHRAWTPQQIKSALMITAHPGFADTGETAEAPVLLEGAGVAYLPAADDPKLVSNPASVSLADLNANHGAQTEGLLVQLSDAGDGAGDWAVTVVPQSATGGVAIDVPPSVAVAPGGGAALPVTARISADAQPGEQYGFIVLKRNDVVRRIPYFFLVSRPALEQVKATELQPLQVGATNRGTSRVSIYRYPSNPFGPAPNFVGPPMAEDGAETLYVTHLNRTAANIGVAVLAQSNGALIDPWFLGSPDENDVLGYMGTPVNVNLYMLDYRFEVGAAGQQYPRQGIYWISLDSGRDRLTGRRLDGQYLLHAWVNDVTPPRVSLVTTRVSAGRPTLVLRATDAGAGVDPFSIVLAYGRQLVAAAAFDPFTGLAFVPLPAEAAAIPPGKVRLIFEASDYQETKNLDQASANPLPNTGIRVHSLRVVNGPTVQWLLPTTSVPCGTKSTRLVVAAGSTRKISAVAFFDGTRKVAVVKRGVVGLYATTWRTAKAARGKHLLRVLAVDSVGRTASATRTVRICASK